MKLKNIGYAVIIAATAVAFVIGSAMPSEAKGKKAKKVAAPQYTPSCMFNAGNPVCAVKGGNKFTYKNACYAGNDGAKVVANKACPVKAAKKGGGKKKGGKKKGGKKK
jgi:hypothetical protein